MFAVTERLLLRPGWVEDAPSVAAVLDDREVSHNLMRVPWPYSQADAETFLSLPTTPMRPRFLICLRASNQLVGAIGISGDIEAELGYWIARDHWGHGYATEAGRAVLALADDSLRLARIKARRTMDNARSANVLRKLGFRPTGERMWSASLTRGTVETCCYRRERESAAQALAA